MVITIIGILIGMMLPAVMGAREAARRAQCANNLSQIGIALCNYESTHGMLPPGTIDKQGPIHNVPKGYHVGWLVQLLPYLDENVAFEHIDLAVGVYDKENAPVRAIMLSTYLCPSLVGPSRIGRTAPTDASGAGGDFSPGAICVSTYAGCHNDAEAPIDADNSGVLFLNSHVRQRDVTDGMSHTIYVGEKLSDESDLGWMSGTRATLRNGGARLNLPVDDAIVGVAENPPQSPAVPLPMTPGAPITAAEPAPPPPPPAAKPPVSDLYVGGFASEHPGTCNLLFGDGAVRSVMDGIDVKLLRLLANRADGQLLTEGPTRQ